MNTNQQYQPIDWLALTSRLQQSPVPQHAYKAFVSLRFQATVLEAAIINYAAFSQTNPLETATRSIAAARSIAHEAASFLKIAESVCKLTARDKGNCRSHLEKYASLNPGILLVRNALSHLYEGIASGSESESILFGVINGYIQVRDCNGVIVEMPVTYALVYDAIELIEGMSIELAKAS